MKSNKIIKFSAVLLGIFLFMAMISPVVAASQTPGSEDPGSKTPGSETPGSNTPKTVFLEDPLNIDSKLDDKGTVLYFTEEIAKFLIAPIGAIAFILLVVGGLFWITSGGNEEKITRGKDIIIWTIVGIVAIFSSYAIINFVLAAIRGIKIG